MIRVAIVDRQFLTDLTYWIRVDQKTALRVMQLIDDVLRDPESGRGSPERLRHFGPGMWSRKVTQEHRMVYEVTENAVRFAQCRFHYGK